MARLARQKRLSDAIDRLAALLPYGDITAATDGGLLLASAADEIERLRALLAAHRRVVEAARRGMVCVGCEHWPGGDMCPDDCVCKPLRCAIAALDELEAAR